MLPVYAAAFLPPAPPTILGVRLRLFSLGHAFILEAASNGYAPGVEGDGSVGELLIALRVCSLDWTGAREFCRAGMEPEAVKEWADDCNAESLTTASTALRAHVVASLQIPRRWKKEGAEGKARVPWPLQCLSALLDGGPMTPANVEAAWNTPVGEAFCLIAGRGAYQGDDSIMSEEDEKAREYLLALKQGEANGG